MLDNCGKMIFVMASAIALSLVLKCNAIEHGEHDHATTALNVLSMLISVMSQPVTYIG